jgi:hypothetical protein
VYVFSGNVYSIILSQVGPFIWPKQDYIWLVFDREIRHRVCSARIKDK